MDNPVVNGRNVVRIRPIHLVKGTGVPRETTKVVQDLVPDASATLRLLENHKSDFDGGESVVHLRVVCDRWTVLN